MTPAERHRESKRKPCTCFHPKELHTPFGCRVQGCKCGLPAQVRPTPSKMLEQRKAAP